MSETELVGASELVLGHKYEAGHAYWARFMEEIVARDLPHERFVRWETTSTSLEGLLDYATHSSRLPSGWAALLDLEGRAGCLAVVNVKAGGAVIRLAAATIAALAGGEAFLREHLPERVATEDQTVPIVFWSYGCYGPAELSRSIDVPTWADIRRNYPARVSAELDPLMSGEFRPDGRGQLLLWHGPPGTGKTYGLRALGWQWRAWCAFHYVTDPETFFGRPDYMLEVILGDDAGERDEKKWKLLVLEDTGELLAADAKAQAGQGLSRLLNVVDGIIGQGLRILVLVTTNDDLRQLHGAVSRPGRCLAKVEFAQFTTDEAGDWLAQNGVESDGRASTLASLFGVAAGEAPPARPPIGFGR